jgi:hypothetical protein
MENIVLFPLVRIDINDVRRLFTGEDCYYAESAVWGGYAPRLVDGVIEISYDLIVCDGKEYLL